MKITMLRNPPASVGCDLTEGQTGNVDKGMAKKLFALGVAESLEPVKAVAKAADIKGESASQEKKSKSTEG